MRIIAMLLLTGNVSFSFGQETMNKPPESYCWHECALVYHVKEGSGPGTLSADKNGRVPFMYEPDRERIRYTLSTPYQLNRLGPLKFGAREPSDPYKVYGPLSISISHRLVSLFNVCNIAPDPLPDDSDQSISISYNSLDHETAPEFADGTGRGYEFDVIGCDPHDVCSALKVRVYVLKALNEE